MKESAIERYLVQQVEAIGGIAYKFTSPARRNVPDRLVLFPSPPSSGHLGIRAHMVTIRFVELKVPGKKPTAAQQREHERLRNLGFSVRVIDSKEEVDRFISAYK